MPEALTPDELQQMIERDNLVSGGFHLPDHFVYEDRHHLIQEVLRLNNLILRLKQGRPAS